jgi:hypothetical protein
MDAEDASSSATDKEKSLKDVVDNPVAEAIDSNTTDWVNEVSKLFVPVISRLILVVTKVDEVGEGVGACVGDSEGTHVDGKDVGIEVGEYVGKWVG